VFKKEWIYELGLDDKIFLLLIGSIALVFILAVVFSVTAVLFRMKNNALTTRWKRLEEKWEADTIALLAGDRDYDSLWQLVDKKEEINFVDFLMRFARRLHGTERHILSNLAHPYLPLVAVNTKNGNTERRAAAVQALSVLGLPAYADHVVAALNDPSPLVAMIAARAFAREKYAGHAQTIIDNIDRFGNWTIGFLSSMLSSLSSDAAPTLRRSFADPKMSRRVRTVLAESLRELHDPQAADLAVQWVATEDDREVLAACLRLLSEVGRPQHIEAIRPLVSSPDFVVRAHTMSALAALGSEDEVPILREAFMDPSPWVALRAAKGLLKLGRAAVLIELAGASHDRAHLARQILAEEVMPWSRSYSRSCYASITSRLVTSRS
jgi:hypothetical protein